MKAGNYFWRPVSIFLFLATVIIPSQASYEGSSPWRQLEAGLEIATFLSPQKSDVGDSLIHILKIDPVHFRFRLLNASRRIAPKKRSARQWAEVMGLQAVINASLYQADNLTSVSFMKTGKHTNNSWISKDKAVLAFDPIDPSLPRVQILDRDCQDFAHLRGQYRTLIQSIRMISCEGENVWQQQKKKRWSAAAIGMDARGSILFIHSRSLFTTHDLIRTLLKLPIDLKRAMYVEGGPEAQLFIRSKKQVYEFIGNFSQATGASFGNTIAWPVPNVVGIERRKSE